MPLSRIDQSSYRFPGIRPFEGSDAKLFFSREREINLLSLMIKVENVIVIYGKHGVGKTSLINAGFQNHNNFENWNKILIRFGAYFGQNETLVHKTIEAIDSYHSNQTFSDQYRSNSQIDTNEESIWTKLKVTQVCSEAENIEFILIFDQLEEIFSWPPYQIEHFKKSLAYLTSDHLPLNYQENILEGNLSPYSTHFLGKDSEVLLSPINIKIVFVIRSDYLGQMITFKDIFPNILLHTLQVNGLTLEKAKMALVHTLSIAGNYSSPAIYLSEDAVMNILEALQDERGEIEPLQIQLIGITIESFVLEEGPNRHVVNVEDIQHMFLKLYSRLLDRLTPEERPDAQYILEELMLSEKPGGIVQRVILDETTLLNQFKVREATLLKLVDTRLLQQIYNKGRILYEISSDVFITPMLESRNNRLKNKMKNFLSRPFNKKLK